ncbi:hypothetical protein K1719_047260 [Acacia pycnantha]|nr:hypothetical protein K1719_047260 [Acacia pycnantha]
MKISFLLWLSFLFFSSISGILNLAFNNFNSAIPSSIRDLKNLTSMNLSSAGFVDQIPMEIAQLTRLTILDLSTSYYLAKSALKLENPNLEKLVQTLSEVRELYLDDINIALNGNEWGHALSSFLPYLQVIPMEIAQLTRLTILDLSYLPAALKLEDPNLEKLVQTLSEVRELYLDGINITLNGNEWGHTLSSFLPHLQVRCHTSHKIVSQDVESKHDKFLRSITSIQLSNNHLSQGQLDAISNVPSSTLQVLDLSSNYLRGPIPEFIFDLKGLKVLQLSSNKFNGTLRLDKFERLLNLTTLGLSNNNLSIDANVRNANRLSFPNMTSLMLASCNLRQFPSFLRNMSRLTYLDLSNNGIAEKIPKWIWELGNLGQLNLSHNSIREIESTPQTFISNNLYVLDLHDNCLQGILPAFPPFASYLDYSYNKFSSVIPSDIGNYLSKTIFLSLSHNALYEGIPDSIFNASYLQVLDLSNNNFSGVIPHCLAKSATLGVMVLRRNNFHGHIGCPNIERMTWKMLQIVDLAFNNFSGMLPGEYFPTWKAMMLDKNQTSSKANQIDFNFGFSQWNYQDRVIVTMKGREMTLTKILTVFTSIDFSSNRIEGSIPQEMMDFTALIELNLSNNNLVGQIPSSMWKLHQLESLDLSNNSFTGEIPSQLASLSFLSYLNLSHNHLVGKIPTGTQLQSFEASSFQGNDGLYGPPLTQSPTNEPQGPTSGDVWTTSPDDVVHNHAFDFEFIKGLELGVIFGLGIIIGPLFFWRRWTIRYWRCVDSILCSIFPQIYVDYQRREGQWIPVLRWSH